jgi:uncharacterized membrane protein
VVSDPADQDGQAAGVLPFVAPCRPLPPLAALGWLRRGWSDLKRAPRQSLAYGLAIVVLSWAVTGIGLRLGSYWAVLVLMSGFVFVAPLLALGLYSISRQLEAGSEPRLSRCLAEQRRALGNALVFTLALLVLFLVWARAGSLVHALYPAVGADDIRELAVFLGVGTAVGSIFALLTFMFSAFSLPMICDREVDAVTAIVTSVNAVLRNKRAMTVWALLIVVLTGIGFATALIGLALTVPLLGHATWHAYREAIDAEAWPRSAER